MARIINHQNHRKMKYTVRRHLGRGENYGFFQIRGHVTDSKQGDVVEYINPSKFNIHFFEVKLYNKVNPSLKIYSKKSSKMPCAWLIFDSYVITPKQELQGSKIEFNPIKNPFWINDKGQNIDNSKFPVVKMNENKLYI